MGPHGTIHMEPHTTTWNHPHGTTWNHGTTCPEPQALQQQLQALQQVMAPGLAMPPGLVEGLWLLLGGLAVVLLQRLAEK